MIKVICNLGKCKYLIIKFSQIDRSAKMDIFNIIAGVSSIISLLITLFVADRVVKISTKLNINADLSTKDMSKMKAVQKGNKLEKNSTMSGRDTNVNK